MAKARIRAGWVTGCLVLLATAATSSAAPTVAQMLSFRPKQDGITYTTPSPVEQTKCTVELVKAGRGSGWLLKDEKGEVLRRYLDTNADNKIDIWSYYHKGVEVYREIDSNYNDKVDQYRWFHSAGTKWGVDPTEDGKIKTWRVISPEEVSQEVLQAVIKRDYSRFQALLMTEADIKMLDLPQAEANRVRESVQKAQAKFQETVSKLSGMNDQTRWDHLELATPQCVPADTNGLKQDLVRYTSAVALYQVGDDTKNQPLEAKGLQLGEMIQVGTAWRLIDAPVPGSLIRGGPAGDTGDGGIIMNKELEALYKELGDHDKTAPGGNARPADLHRYHIKRADILERMIAQVAKLDPKDYKPEERDQWLKQVADCLGTAAQNSSDSDKSAYQRLVALRDKMIKDHVDSNLAGYVLYAEIMADYNARMNNPKGDDLPKVQKELLERLSKFVTDYPKADNAPEALMQLCMISELMNEEAQAKKWCEMFVKNYPTHPLLKKLEGVLARLDSNGKEMVLAGAPLTGGSPFDIKSLKGKVIVVYYWASWNGQSAADLEKLKKLLGEYAAKGLEVVCVNLDDEQAKAKEFLQGKQAPATHLYEANGMSGKLGEQYGIMVLPTMFLVGKDGKVISHTVQMTTAEDEIKKALN
jgi:thiol-disulfide isomerase/thioredoxin